MPGYGGGYGQQGGNNGGGYSGQRSGNVNAGYNNGGNRQQQNGGKPKEKKVYPSPTTFDEAKVYKLNFGKHKGRSLNNLAIDDEGLQYLTWLAETCDGAKYPDTYAALGLFLSDERVQAAIDEMETNRASGGPGRF